MSVIDTVCKNHDKAEIIIQLMLARRVKQGFNASESLPLLTDLILSAGSADNLTHALTYNGFAAEKLAEKFSDIVFS